MAGDWLLYDNPLSGNCWKARQILTATHVPFRLKEVPVIGDRELDRARTPVGQYLAGRIPMMVGPDGRQVAESGAILLEFGESSSFLPAGGEARRRVMQWMFFEQSTHMPFLAGARYQCAIAGTEDDRPEVVAFLRARGRIALSIMERHLTENADKNRGWFTSSARMTVADIALYPYTRMAPQGGLDLDDYPHVQRWLATVEADPAHLALPPGVADIE